MENEIQSGIYRVLSLVAFLGVSLLGFTQVNSLVTDELPGFVLSTNYDTIYCDISYKFNEDKSLNAFVTRKNDKELVINDDIALYNRANEIYVKNNFAIGPEYLKVMEDGALKLLGFANFKNEKQAKKSVLNMSSEGFFYYIIEAEGGSYIGNISPKNRTTFFIEKDDKIFRLQTLEFKEQLLDLVGSALAETIEDLDYRQIPLFVREYNKRSEEGDNKYFAYKILNDDAGEVLESEFDVDRVFNDKVRATDEINLLFENALIVRLKTNKRKIEAYRGAGLAEKADELEFDLKMTNIETIQVFKNNFDFCPVYFINSEDYNLAINEQPGIYLNEKGEKDPNIVFEHATFLFCDRGAAYAPVLADQNDANTKMVSSTPTIQDAFVIKNKYLEQLVEPFPYKVSIRFDNLAGSVKKLNANMVNFYGK